MSATKTWRVVSAMAATIGAVMASPGVAFALNSQPEPPGVVPEISASGSATALALIVGALALMIDRGLRRRRR
jgi:anti-sigma-K factor RskA